MAKTITSTNPYLMRYRPDCRFNSGKFEMSAKPPLYPSSITDKEAYRVSLAAARGNLAQGSGSPTVGKYTFEAGENYDATKDFSILRRPDLTIVQLDEYIEAFKKRLEKSDELLAEQIKVELAEAEKKREELLKQDVSTTNPAVKSEGK